MSQNNLVAEEPFMFEKIDQETQSLIEKARKSGKKRTGLMGMFISPDHYKSADLYSQAGNRLKYLNMSKEAAECYLNSGDEYMLAKHSGYLFFAAEAYCNSYALSPEKGVLIKACELYCENNSYSLAASYRKKLLDKERGEEALQSLDFVTTCYEKAGMKMNRLSYVEKKGVVCVGLKRYREAGECFRECNMPLYAFLAYFLDGNEGEMKKLDFKDEVAMSFYGGGRAKNVVEAISKYKMNNVVKEEHSKLFEDVLERMKPEHDIL